MGIFSTGSQVAPDSTICQGMQYVLMQRHLQVNIKPEHADVKNERWCVTLLLPKVTAFCLHWINSEAHQGKMVVEQGQPDGGVKQGGLLPGHCQGRHDS